MNYKRELTVLLAILTIGGVYATQPQEAEKKNVTAGTMEGYVWRYERISDRGNITFTAVGRKYSESSRKHSGYILNDRYGTLNEHFLVVTGFENNHRDVIPIRQLRHIEFRDRKEIQKAFDEMQSDFVRKNN